MDVHSSCPRGTSCHSVLFALGSTAFALDSIFAEASALHGLDGVWPAASSNFYSATQVSHGLVVAGNMAFLPGRLFFVHGATSSHSDALLRTPTERAQVFPTAESAPDIHLRRDRL